MILERIKKYIDYKGISVAAFEKSIGMSNASFGKSLKNKGAIGTDKLENILITYPDISPEWLLTGRGDMIKSNRTSSDIPHLQLPTVGSNTINKDNNFSASDQICNDINSPLISLIQSKDDIIRSQAEEIGRLKERISLLECRLQKDASSADTHHIANVG